MLKTTFNLLDPFHPFDAFFHLTNLIELCEPKLLKVLDYNGVSILNVKPTFYYISGN